MRARGLPCRAERKPCAHAVAEELVTPSVPLKCPQLALGVRNRTLCFRTGERRLNDSYFGTEPSSLDIREAERSPHRVASSPLPQASDRPQPGSAPAVRSALPR